MITRISIAAVVLTAVFSLTGCSAMSGAAEAGEAGVDFVMGILKADIQATPPQIAEATKRAFKVYDIKVYDYRTTELDAVVIGYTATEKKIDVTIKRESDDVSELSIHVGIMGEESFSNLLYEEIKRQLVQGASGVTTYAVPMTTVSEAPTLAPASGY